MDVLNKIEAIWRNVSLVQRALLIGVVVTVAIAGLFLTKWATRPDMRLLYSNLDAESAGKISDKVAEKGIAFELSRDGTSVYVPREHVTQLRLEMARAGLPDSGQKGYGLFDSQKIGVSPFVQNVNLKRALEEELAKSIQYMDGVVHARVHVVTPEHSLFSSQADETTASVVLKLKPGYSLSAMNIAAITHLVAGSVEGVKSDGVTLVDSEGRLLSNSVDQMMSNGASTVADYKDRVERSLETKAESMLETVLGPGRASVRVSVEIDMTSDVTRTTTPTKGVTKKEEITKSEEPGVVGAGSTDKKKDSTTITETETGQTVTETTTPPGEITSRTIAVLVDLSDDDPNVATPIMSIEDVNDIIKNTLGYKATDSIKVVEAKFRRQEDTSLGEEEAGGLDFVAIAGQASMGIMAICAVVVLKVFKGSRKKAAPVRSHLSLPGDGNLPALTAGEESEEEEEQEELELMELRRRIGDSLRSNPEQAKRLFTSWLEEARS